MYLQAHLSKNRYTLITGYNDHRFNVIQFIQEYTMNSKFCNNEHRKLPIYRLYKHNINKFMLSITV